jgi:hypothetical protein
VAFVPTGDDAQGSGEVREEVEEEILGDGQALMDEPEAEEGGEEGA